MEDFNMTTSNPILYKFFDTFALSPLNINPIYFKNSKIQVASMFWRQIWNLVLWKQKVFETGISDHHKMIFAIMKFDCTRGIPKTKFYQNYHKFDIDYFSSELSRQLNSTLCSIKKNEDWKALYEYSWFYRVFLNLLNIQAPLKKEILRGNSSPLMTKTIMIRSRLKNSFNKTRSDENWSLYKKNGTFARNC